MKLARIFWGVTALASLGILAGCPAREVSKVNPAPVRESTQDIPIEVNRDLDLLFVIDNSISMADEQSSLLDNFSRFIDVLSGIEGGLPNVRIAVVTSDMGTLGQNLSGCDSPVEGGDNGDLKVSCVDEADPVCASDPDDSRCDNPVCDYTACKGLAQVAYLENVEVLDDDGNVIGRRRNYADNNNDNGTPGDDTDDYGDLDEDLAAAADTLELNFQCRAAVGKEGCGLEQHLEAMRTALTRSEGDFLREDAFLAVVIIADEDDCSASQSIMFDNGTLATDQLGATDFGFRCVSQGVECDQDMFSQGLKTNCQSKEDSSVMHGVDTYFDFISTIKPDLGKVFVATIAENSVDNTIDVVQKSEQGVSPQTFDVVKNCGVEGDPDSGARPTIRLKSFAEKFGNSSQTSICDENLGPALQSIAERLALQLGTKCVPAGIVFQNDLPQCTVKDTSEADLDGQGTVIPRCPAGSDEPAAADQPCWRFIDDPNCEATTGQSLEVLRNHNAWSRCHDVVPL